MSAGLCEQRAQMQGLEETERRRDEETECAPPVFHFVSPSLRLFVSSSLRLFVSPSLRLFSLALLHRLWSATVDKLKPLARGGARERNFPVRLSFVATDR